MNKQSINILLANNLNQIKLENRFKLGDLTFISNLPDRYKQSTVKAVFKSVLDDSRIILLCNDCVLYYDNNSQHWELTDNNDVMMAIN